MNMREPKAGGALIALGAMAGAIGGLYAGQPSLGLIIGVASGSAVAVLLWLNDRR